jgi:hypothetical protein
MQIDKDETHLKGNKREKERKVKKIVHKNMMA